jgi:hypothetical protein
MAQIDTEVVYCDDCLDRLGALPANSVDLIYLDPPFFSNRHCDVSRTSLDRIDCFNEARTAAARAVQDDVTPTHPSHRYAVAVGTPTMPSRRPRFRRPVELRRT